ncbi:5-coumarate-CoA ligase [Rhodotorula toruloides]|uniref:5-coumarate-CoA ligase n=1 Tax=Rhodotorula toruloides TaxID=5286 RepID=A0A511KQM7_RHOTO|nr:5-coumarate-CoA ligase [Rhodotorula toruloides]
MPYDAQTGLYTSNFGTTPLPDRALTLFDFLFDLETPFSRDPKAFKRPDPRGRPWILDAHSPRSYTFEQAKERTLDLARAFAARGLKEHDTVLMFSPNDIDYGPCLWATARAGAVSSCANPSYTADELAHQIRTVASFKLIVVHPDALETTAKGCEKSGLSSEMIVLIQPPTKESNPPVNAKPLAAGFPTLDDLIKESRDHPLPLKVTLRQGEMKTRLAVPQCAKNGVVGVADISCPFAPAIRFPRQFLSFSSGTTGLPKAVEIPHYAVITNVLQAIQDHRITTLFLVPPQLILLVKQDIVKKYNLSSVRLTTVAAAPLTKEIFTAFRSKFPGIIADQGYGMTESSVIISLFVASMPDGFPGESAGMLIPNIEAKIVSPEGKALPPGEAGELWSRSPSNALGYLNNEKATPETFDSDGFLHTGDKGYITKDGLLDISVKELIKVSGFQVAPAELEGHLLGHEDVQDCCVIGIPDEKRGEAPKGESYTLRFPYITLTPAAQSRLKSEGEEKIVASIKKWVTDHKIGYKALAEVEFIDVIPKNPSGKLLRKDLRARHAQLVRSRSAKL